MIAAGVNMGMGLVVDDGEILITFHSHIIVTIQCFTTIFQRGIMSRTIKYYKTQG